MELGGGPRCTICQKTVYFTERIMAANQLYHKSCFRCKECNRTLTLGKQCTHNNDIYCKVCYGKKYGPKGYGFGVGAGILTDTGIRPNGRRPSVLSAVPIPKPLRKLGKRISKRLSGKQNVSHAKENSKSNQEVLDLAIVGAGFSGAYMAYRLSKEFPQLNIQIIEKCADAGGRLRSDDNDDDNETNKDELGGMRIFPSVQPEVAEIVQTVGCDLVPVRLSDHTNLYFANGVRQVKKHVVLDPDLKRSYKEMVSDCMTNYAAEHPVESLADPYDHEMLRSMTPIEFLKKYGASDLEVEGWVTYSGYNIFSDDEVSAAIFVDEGKLYGSALSADQKYVKQGFQEVVRRMVKISGVDVLWNSHVDTITNDEDTQLRTLNYTSKNGSTGTVVARNVLLALPQDELVKLCKRGVEGVCNQRLEAMDSVKILPLFKCFLEWARVEGEEQWWREKGFTHGKSTTDLDVRQVHYYDNEDILVYNSGEYAERWNERFNEDPDAAARLAFEMIKQVHGDEDIPEPDWSSTIFKFWPNGSHKWRRGVDVKAMQSIVAVGKGENPNDSNVFVSGDAYSTHQGWTMGCIETVDLCIEAMKERNVLRE